MRKLGVWAAVFAVAGLLAGCSTSNSGSGAHDAATTTTTTSATTTTPTTAAAASAAFVAAKSQWNMGSCAASAVQGQYWQAAATDLQPTTTPSPTTAIADLKQLITLPDMGLTSTQSSEFQTDVQYLDAFFDTPGLYSTATGNCPNT